MDTKLKILSKNRLTQSIVQIILTILVLVVGLNIIFTDNYSGIFYYKLYESAEFSYEFERRIHNVIEKEFVLKSLENIEQMTKTTESEKKQVGSLEQSEQVYYNGNYYENKISRWYQIEANLSKTPSFKYFITNLDTGEEYSNFSDLREQNSLSKYPFHLSMDGNKIEAIEIREGQMIYLSEYSHSPILEEASNVGNWEGIFVLDDQVGQDDLFMALTERYNKIIPFFKNQSQIYAGMIGTVLIGIFLFAYLVISSIVNKDAQRRYSDYIPNDLKIALILISIPVMFDLFISEFTFEPFIMSGNQNDQWLQIAFIVVIFVWILLGLKLTLSLVRETSNGRLFKNTMIFGSLRKSLEFVSKILKSFSRSKVFRRRILIYVTLYGGMNYILGLLFCMDYELLSLFLWFTLNPVFLYLTYRNLQSLHEIMCYVSEGDVSNRLDTERISPLLYSFANHINGMQANLEMAIQEAIKGERLKTELITNVSHDLKTPLTAIINYTALLKKKEIDDEETVKYIQIVDEKAGVLKRLIDDVLEISKVSSGNVEINIEPLDINQLIQQVLGEFEEALESQNLKLITTELSTPLYVNADSLKLWRVVQNLISNITKYAMPNSRVFIFVKEQGNSVVVEFKNISKEMLISGDNDLAERFVRGDVSRTMEGFGLGLAIASDLMKLQKGQMDIIVDGDLFKVVLMLNVCEK